MIIHLLFNTYIYIYHYLLRTDININFTNIYCKKTACHHYLIRTGSNINFNDIPVPIKACHHHLPRTGANINFNYILVPIKACHHHLSRTDSYIRLTTYNTTSSARPPWEMHYIKKATKVYLPLRLFYYLNVAPSLCSNALTILSWTLFTSLSFNVLFGSLYTIE